MVDGPWSVTSGLEEAEKEREAQRSRAEMRRLKQRISFVAKQYVQYGIDVLPLPLSDPEQTWKCAFSPADNAVLSAELKKYLETKELDNIDHLPDALFRPQTIFYPESSLQNESEPVVMGTLDHETWHARFDNFKDLVENSRLALDEGYMPSSIGMLANGLADGRITYRGVGESSIIRKRQVALHEEYIQDLDKWPRCSVTRQFALLTKLKMVKDFLGLISERDFQKLKDSLDPEVQRIFDEVEPDIARYFDAKTSAEANKILRECLWDPFKVLEEKAKEDNQMKKLFEQAQGGDQSGGQQAGQGQPGQGQPGQGQPGGGGGGQPIPFDQLPPELQDAVREEIERQRQQQAQQGQQGQQGEQGQGQSGGQGQPSADGAPSGQESSSGQASGSAQPSGNESSSGVSGSPQDVSDAVRGQVGQTAGQQPIDISQIPDDLKEQLKKGIEEMSEPAKSQLQKDAKQDLDAEQAEEANKNAPQGIRMKPGDNGEFTPQIDGTSTDSADRAKEDIDQFDREEAAAEAKKEAFRKAIDKAQRPDDVEGLMDRDDVPWQHRQELEEKAERRKEQLERERAGKIRDMKSEGFLESGADQPSREDEALYDAYKVLEAEILQDVRTFVRMMEREIPKKETIGDSEVQRRRSGKQLDTKGLSSYHRRAIGKVFHAREEVLSDDPRMMVGLVLDISTSMAGDKLRESLKTLLLFAFGLEAFEIDLAIYLFDDRTEKMLEFGGEFGRNARVKYALMKMLCSVNGGKVSFSGRGGTDMGKALEMMNTDLNEHKRRFPDYMSALFAISDGETFGQLSGDKLTRFVQGWGEYKGRGDGIKPEHLALGFFLRGLAEGASSAQRDAQTPMEKYFGPRGEGTVVVDNYADLMKEAFTALKQALLKMKRRLRLPNP